MHCSISIVLTLYLLGLVYSDKEKTPDKDKDVKGKILDYGTVIGIDLGTTYSW